MCGIAGSLGYSPTTEIDYNSVLTSLANRGPDNSSKIFLDNIENKNINLSLFHTRLSIIDLNSRANQPYKSNNCILIFNGEIYNYVELKNHLISKGITFETNSDTEVLLKSYLFFGNSFLEHLEGMWAFAIWDNNKKKLLISRDRFGEKPLFYYFDKNNFFFASETNALRKLVNKNFDINFPKMYDYLGLGYKSLNKDFNSFYKNIFKLPNSSYLEIDLNLNKKKEIFWKPQIKTSSFNKNYQDEIKEILINGLKKRIRSDVPLAVSLSGGIDSTIIASIIKKKLNCDISSYSIIDEDERYNEAKNINATVNDLEIQNKKIKINNPNNIEKLEELINYHDSPIPTISQFIHSYLCSEIKKDKIKVVFSGVGADEVFTGYYEHFITHLFEMHKIGKFDEYKKSWETHIKPRARNKFYKDEYLFVNDPGFRDHVYHNHVEFNEWFSDKNIKTSSYKETNYTNSLMKNRMLNELFAEIVPAMVQHEDLNAMMNSIENRSPFLDHKLLDKVMSLPEEIFIKNGYNKIILRDLSKNIITDKVRNDRTKKGFNASISSLINLKDKNIKERFLDKSNQSFEIIDRNKIIKYFDSKHIQNQYSKFLFSFINISIFLS